MSAATADTEELDLPLHHKEELARLYAEHSVGDTVAHKVAFWNARHPGTNISHCTGDEMRVACFETSHLCDTFPQDFHTW